MNTRSAIHDNQVSGAASGHAIVIGSSIAGLAAAHVLTDHFARVTIIERDHLPDTPQFRRGVPQARHAHILPLRGQMILEEQFPGLADELVANGAIPINGASEMAVFFNDRRQEVRHRSALVSVTFSRPLLETTIYRRVAIHPGVRTIQEREVVGLTVDKRGEHVTGVRLRSRGGPYAKETILKGELVVDASGRQSQASHWLASLGYIPPEESIVNAFSGYATRIYQRPAGFTAGWKTLLIRPTPPDGTRGGLVIPIEDDRWHVTLIGMAGDYPPIDEASFLAFARSLPTQELYQAIKEAKPLTKPYGYRGAINRLRHYEKLPCYLEGFLVSGDAVYTLNPVYAQGITAAAMSSLALDHSLKVQGHQDEAGGMPGLAGAFQKRLSQVIAGPWQVAIREDQRWPATEVADGALPARHHISGLRGSPALAPIGSSRAVSEAAGSHCSYEVAH